ncbi:MAG: lipopolysaccharide biosynthesis protein RfbH [Candidatus Velamenicoccus archaeovorus]
MSIKAIEQKILSLVREYYRAIRAHRFIPGKTLVNYGGRVFDEKEIQGLVKASLDFWLTAGPLNQAFEQALADFVNVKYCLTVNSGSSADLLAVTALTSPLLKDRRLKRGDEVITTACGFPTTLNPILQNNLVPVFLDVELGTYNIRADLVEKAITKRTKAIFIAHALGNPADMAVLGRLAARYRLWLLEDNCDALGSRYNKRYTGSFGHMATCSFYPAHHITTGEGGAVLTSDPLLKKIVQSLRDWGRDCWCGPGQDNSCRRRFTQQFGRLPKGYDHKYVYSHIGYNLKMTDLQAAVGLAQMKKLDGFIRLRREHFARILRHLKSYEKYLLLPQPQKDADPAWFGFPVFVRDDAGFSRDQIVAFLEKNKIATRMFFGGNLLRQPAYEKIKYKICGSLTHTDAVMNRLFWFGVYPGLTQSMIRHILDTFDRFLTGYKR